MILRSYLYLFSFNTDNTEIIFTKQVNAIIEFEPRWLEIIEKEKSAKYFHEIDECYYIYP